MQNTYAPDDQLGIDAAFWAIVLGDRELRDLDTSHHANRELRVMIRCGCRVFRRPDPWRQFRSPSTSGCQVAARRVIACQRSPPRFKDADTTFERR